MNNDIRDLLSRMADELDHYRQLLSDDRREVHALATEARAALAAEPVGEGQPASVARAATLLQQQAAPAPEVGSAAALATWLRSHSGQCVELGRPDWAHMADRAAYTLEAFRLGGWIVPTVEEATPPAPEPGDVGELVEWLEQYRDLMHPVHDSDDIVQFTRIIILLSQLSAPAPVAVPVAVSDALIKAECALSDIAEGEPEPNSDSADLLKWAERRCAETLAVIRPAMKQHKIRTSEWPPQPQPLDAHH